MAAPPELPAQLDVVEDFPVRDQGKAAPLAVERLPPPLRVDDAEPTHGKKDVIHAEPAFSIRAAMAHQRNEATGSSVVMRIQLLSTDYAGDTAHSGDFLQPFMYA